MGVVNLTPDSFYSQSRKYCKNLYDDIEYRYADMIDIGCESSRPGAEPLSEKKELSRLTQFLDKQNMLPRMLSIDTYKPTVARTHTITPTVAGYTL